MAISSCKGGWESEYLAFLASKRRQAREKSALCIQYTLRIFVLFFSLFLGYEPPQALSPPALPPPAPSPPAWQARALGTARLQLVEFSAFVEPPDAVDSVSAILESSLAGEGRGWRLEYRG